MTGEYTKTQKVRSTIPEIGSNAVVLLNIPEVPIWKKTSIKEKRYFDSHWHVFETPEGNKVLSKEGWFGTYIFDAQIGMRTATDSDWIDLKDGWQKLKEGLEKVPDDKDVKEFMMKKYFEKITPKLFVEL